MVMNKTKVITTASILITGVFLGARYCLSNEAPQGKESENKASIEGPRGHIDIANEQYKQAQEYAKYGLHDEAIEMYLKSLATNANNIDAYKNLGLAYFG